MLRVPAQPESCGKTQAIASLSVVRTLINGSVPDHEETV